MTNPTRKPPGANEPAIRSFSVKNFDKFQHYKDRSPPWIKLYNELLDDYEFGLLSDASKFHLVAIWLLASRSNNKIPYDQTWVARRINATGVVDLDGLAAGGFIVLDQELQIAEQYASTPQAECLSRGEGQVQHIEQQKDAVPSERTPVASEKELFDRGKQVLGKSAGGQIVKLLRAKGNNIALARAAIEQASTKHDPSQYIAAAIRGGAGPPAFAERETNGFVTILKERLGQQHEPDHLKDITPAQPGGSSGAGGRPQLARG